MRCFVAAFLEPASAAGLQSAFEAVCAEDDGALAKLSMRRVPPDNYHVTLKFIGETGEAALPELLSTVADLEGHATQTEVRRFVGFPRPAAARLAAGELPPEPRLQAWAAALETALGTADRAFRPHVTLARFRLPVAFHVRGLGRAIRLELQPPALYRSEETARGVRYRRLTAAP